MFYGFCTSLLLNRKITGIVSMVSRGRRKFCVKFILQFRDFYGNLSYEFWRITADDENE